MKYFIVSGRTIFFYGLIVVVYKWMGKREIGELSIVDFIVSLFIAELVAISIDDYQESFFISFIPIMILVFLQILTSHISFQHKKMRDVLDGKPSVIVNRGRVNFREMKRIRYNLDDLLFINDNQPLGVNIYNGDKKISPEDICKEWYNENKFYNYDIDKFQKKAIHFTQIVWKNTIEVGFAFTSKKSIKCIGVALYYPAGNIFDEFKDNVKPISK